MSEINQQNINNDQQNQLLNQSQILNPKQQTWSPNALTQLTTKHRIHPIKIVYPQELENLQEERQTFAKSETKKSIFDRRRIFTNRFKTQVSNKQSKDSTIQQKQQQRDNLSYQPLISKRSNLKKNIFFDQIVLSPKERLESFRTHLKAVRQQNQTYLKNKMNVIKQKIKRKRQNAPNQRTKGTFWSKKYEKTKDKPNEKILKIQKYDDELQQDMIRKSIQIQKCQVLNYGSQGKLIFQDEQRTETKSQMVKKQKRVIKEPIIVQNKQQIKIRGQNRIRISLAENGPQKEESYKMMVVNRLSPLKNVISVIKPQKELEKKKIDTGGLQVRHFFNIKALDQTVNIQNPSHKYSKSFDISLMKRIEKKLSHETTAHNFIKGSVIYRLLKERNLSKNSQTLYLQANNSQKKVEDESIVIQAQEQVQKQQLSLQNVEVLQQPQRRKKVVVLSNKNITRYKSEYEGRIGHGCIESKIDQNEQSFGSQFYFGQQQKKG